MKKTVLITALALLPVVALPQAKKPTIMVVPADTWCVANGFTTPFETQGGTTDVADYEKALNGSQDLYNVITKIGELMSERGFPLQDLQASIKSVKTSIAENEVTTSKSSGAGLAETPLEKLLSVAKADILMEVSWKVNVEGPKKSVTYTLRGIDAYTNKQVAAAQGTGKPSFSSELPILLEEAIIDKMDNFNSQLQAHFDDLFENGREVAITVRIFDNGSGLSFEDEYNGDELTDVIDDWMAQNTQKGRYSLATATENILKFEQVRIPLYGSNNRAMDTRQFGRQLAKYLQAAPYNIPVKIIAKGLGQVNLILGEK